MARGLPNALDLSYPSQKLVLAGGGPSLKHQIQKIRSLIANGARLIAVNEAGNFLISAWLCFEDKLFGAQTTRITRRRGTINIVADGRRSEVAQDIKRCIIRGFVFKIIQTREPGPFILRPA